MLTALRYNLNPESVSCCELATGRSCLALLAERWKAQRALVPVYSPEGVVQPLAPLGAMPYKLKDDLSPDLADVEKSLKRFGSSSDRRTLVVVIHYFGYRIATDEIAALAHDYGALLVEDCAQALVGDASPAENADVVLYSYNKFYPVTDGAHICSRRFDVDLSPPEKLEPLPVETLQAYQSHLNANRHVIEAKQPSHFARWADISASDYERYYSHISQDLSPHAMSPHAQQLVSQRNHTMLAAHRKANCDALLEKLPENLLWREGRCSFAFPIRCNAKQSEMTEALLEHGVAPLLQSNKWTSPPHPFVDDHLLLPLNCSVGDMNMMAMVLEAFK